MSQEDRISQLENRVRELEKLTEDQDIEIRVLKRLNSILKSQADANETKVHDMLELLRKAYRSSTEQLLLFDDIEKPQLSEPLRRRPRVSLSMSGPTPERRPGLGSAFLRTPLWWILMSMSPLLYVTGAAR